MKNKVIVREQGAKVSIEFSDIRCIELNYGHLVLQGMDETIQAVYAPGSWVWCCYTVSENSSREIK